MQSWTCISFPSQRGQRLKASGGVQEWDVPLDVNSLIVLFPNQPSSGSKTALLQVELSLLEALCWPRSLFLWMPKGDLGIWGTAGGLPGCWCFTGLRPCTPCFQEHSQPDNAWRKSTKALLLACKGRHQPRASELSPGPSAPCQMVGTPRFPPQNKVASGVMTRGERLF